MDQLDKVIRFDDLRNRLSNGAAARQVSEVCERYPLDLSVDAVLNSAQDATGLDDFGPTEFIQRLELWIRDAANDPNRTKLGRIAVFKTCVELVSLRQQVHELLRHHPEIHDVKIREPLIILGPPRTGTSHLHGLIATDTRLRALHSWEVARPIVVSNETSIDSRASHQNLPLRERKLAYHRDTGARAEFANSLSEDFLLQFSNFPPGLWQLMEPVPRWQYYFEHDHSSHYRYMKMMLQLLQWLRGPHRWVLKSPLHSEHLGPLLSTFPDSTIVMTHRDPVAIVQSLTVMKFRNSAFTHHQIDPRSVFSSCVERIERNLRTIMRDYDMIRQERLVEVPFCDFMADQLGAVARVYSAHGLSLQRKQLAHMEEFINRNPRGRHGRVMCDLQEDFGVELTDLRRRFAFYEDFYHVDVEVV